jgi:hypothetical protein
MSGWRLEGPPSVRKESSVRMASRYALFLKDIAETHLDEANFHPDGRQTESVFQKNFKVSCNL